MKFKIAEILNKKYEEPSEISADRIQNRPDVEKVIRYIKKNCKPYLAELSGSKLGLYRGINSAKYVFIGKVNKNRKSVDTSKDLHKLFDQAFLKVFGWPARSSGLFSTGRYWTAGSYGKNNYYIFPIGPIQYVYSPKIADLYSEHMDDYYFLSSAIKYKKIPKAIINKLQKEYNGILVLSWQNSHEYRIKILGEIMEPFIQQNYTDKNLLKGIKSGNEISILCDKYVAVQYDKNEYETYAQKILNGVLKTK